MWNLLETDPRSRRLTVNKPKDAAEVVFLQVAGLGPRELTVAYLWARTTHERDGLSVSVKPFNNFSLDSQGRFVLFCRL